MNIKGVCLLRVSEPAYRFKPILSRMQHFMLSHIPKGTDSGKYTDLGVNR